jgi:hypothetical protein
MHKKRDESAPNRILMVYLSAVIQDGRILWRTPESNLKRKETPQSRTSLDRFHLPG